MRLSQHRSFKFCGLIADIPYYKVNLIAKLFYLEAELFWIKKRQIDVFAQCVHIDLKTSYRFNVKCQEQVIILLSDRRIVGVILVIIDPQLAECLCILNLQRQDIVCKRREYTRCIEKALQKI